MSKNRAFSRKIGLPSGFAAVRRPDFSIFRAIIDVSFVCTLRRLSTPKKAKAEGFELYTFDSNVADGFCTSLDFRFYRDGHEVIAITYNYFHDAIANSAVPSEEFNLHEITVNGRPAIVSEEEGQYTMITKDGNLETIITSDCGYQECDKIIASLK